MTDAQPLLALAVQHILAEKGMTQAELAAAIKAKPSDLSRRLSGEVPLEDRDIPRVARGLGIEPKELVDHAAAIGWKSAQGAVQAKIREMRAEP